MALTSAAPYLALLSEEDPELKSYALSSLNGVVDQLWAEIANNITEIEALYEDEKFSHRALAALVASKVYYNLGDYDSSVKYSLCSESAFDLDEKTEYVETIISKCIDRYISLSQTKFSDPSVKINSQLTLIFEKMLEKCISQGEIKLALGIAMESYRLDIVEDIIRTQLRTSANEESVLSLVGYVLSSVTTVIANIGLRVQILNTLVLIILSLKSPDYFMISKIIVQLNDYTLAHKIFKELLVNGDHLTAFQVAFDLVNSASQELLDKTSEILTKDENLDQTNKELAKLLKVLSGVPTCDLDITFLYNNNNTDISILNKSKQQLDGRNSIFHSAITFQNAFMHAGTTDDSFFRSNLEWLGKATNWSKFSATAALGVIHKGNLSQGMNLLKPYLPGSTSSPYTNGGSLFGLGLVYAGHGKEVIEFLKEKIVENNSASDDKNVDVVLHGACLGVGVAGMGLGSEEIYEELKTILYADSAVAGEAAGLAMGLVMLGSGDDNALYNMFQYAQETQHETIVRGLAIGIALVCYGKETSAEPMIDQLLKHQDPILRYGGAYTLALAYCGTSNNSAIKRLLHIAVSDSSDNVRRAAVTALGFVLLRDYTTVPTIVELLSESHNPHVRYGTAMALGISCAGRGLPAAVEVLEPLTKDAVDFVRQGAHIAMSMIMIQQNEKTFPKVNEVKESFAKVVGNKNEDSLAKFGAALAQGIIDAGGRNVTIQLENSQTGTLNMKAIVGLTVFSQYWYWFPFTHFLALSFTPTSIIGIREDFKVPKFEINCHTKPDLFGYPPKVETAVEKQPEKVATAVLSTTVRAKARAKKVKAEKEKKEEEVKVEDKMDVDDEPAKPEVSEPVAEELSNDETVADNEEDSSSSNTYYTQTPYKLNNMSRVVPSQLKYIAFVKDERFTPIRKFKGTSGIVVLKDAQFGEPLDRIKTVRELNNTDAPLPDPFTLEDSDDEEEAK
ncbi:unnamed protein product [Kuraishia capsulata CBS 1993]|uniref:26S proteasome regulatory subunit RPN2 n=1 Tax=Kuraishia capsulata CBS 1993 TaxID=1382522 RepID=W6MI88_9ASCO|nr:uncharacterized protein KUCA_T00001578001 [Kuraishia capsulata CBS 1993]CDK25608.1 unnamed protein product [Kuraishia capsulata CBS 1993]